MFKNNIFYRVRKRNHASMRRAPWASWACDGNNCGDRALEPYKWIHLKRYQKPSKTYPKSTQNLPKIYPKSNQNPPKIHSWISLGPSWPPLGPSWRQEAFKNEERPKNRSSDPPGPICCEGWQKAAVRLIGVAFRYVPYNFTYIFDSN